MKSNIKFHNILNKIKIYILILLLIIQFYFLVFTKIEFQIPNLITKIPISKVLKDENIEIDHLIFKFPNILKIERGTYKYKEINYFRNANLKLNYYLNKLEIANLKINN